MPFLQKEIIFRHRNVKLTDVEIFLVNRNPFPQLVGVKERLDVSYLDVGLVRTKFTEFNIL